MHFKRRNIIFVLVMSLITLGIYSLYWIYMTRKELVQASGNPKSIPSFWILLAPILLLTILVGVAFAVTDSATTNGIVNVLGIIGVIGVIVIPLWWFYRYSVTASKVTHGMDSTSLYILFIVLNIFSVGFVWQMLVQNDINKAIDGTTNTTTPEPPYPTHGYPSGASTPPQPTHLQDNRPAGMHSPQPSDHDQNDQQ